MWAGSPKHHGFDSGINCQDFPIVGHGTVLTGIYPVSGLVVIWGCQTETKTSLEPALTEVLQLAPGHQHTVNMDK